MDEDEFQYYLRKIIDEDSFFALIEAGDDILPRLEAQFQKESKSERRAAITQIIWEHRNSKSLVFLAHALADPSESVWKEALNGFVAIGGEEARDQLLSALLTSVPNKTSWIIEAIDQISESLKPAD